MSARQLLDRPRGVWPPHALICHELEGAFIYRAVVMVPKFTCLGISTADFIRKDAFLV
jgi:hypothetical protein